jgi:hypothetical protein
MATFNTVVYNILMVVVAVVFLYLKSFNPNNGNKCVQNGRGFGVREIHGSHAAFMAVFAQKITSSILNAKFV